MILFLDKVGSICRGQPKEHVGCTHFQRDRETTSPVVWKQPSGCGPDCLVSSPFLMAKVRRWGEPDVLVSTGTELIFFLVAGTVLCFGFRVRIPLITR